MSAPIIGLTISHSHSSLGVPLQSVPDAYIQALLGAGAAPVLVPLGMPVNSLVSLLDRLDGILFTGGGDIHPERYHGQSHHLLEGVDEARDQLELDLFQQTLESGKPFLGICRGLQLINVGLGGTLYEDIQDQHPGGRRHQFSPDHPRNHLAHSVQIETGSRLGKILHTTQVDVNSLHHQGIRILAKQLQASAYSPDGIVEAVELVDHPFGLAVQWHPEWLTDQEEMRRLFTTFVESCRKKV